MGQFRALPGDRAPGNPPRFQIGTPERLEEFTGISLCLIKSKRQWARPQVGGLLLLPPETWRK